MVHKNYYWSIWNFAFNYSIAPDYYEPEKTWRTIWIYYKLDVDVVIQWRVWDHFRFRIHNYKNRKTYLRIFIPELPNAS